MIFNKMIPELTVFDIEKTKAFYIDILGFKIEYERPEDKFVFVSYEGSQLLTPLQTVRKLPGLPVHKLPDTMSGRIA